MAVFANSYADCAFEHRSREELRVLGRHVVAVKWIQNGGGIGGSSDEDWRRLDGAVRALDRVWPASPGRVR